VAFGPPEQKKEHLGALFFLPETSVRGLSTISLGLK